jgi:hypothetical protein
MIIVKRGLMAPLLILSELYFQLINLFFLLLVAEINFATPLENLPDIIGAEFIGIVTPEFTGQPLNIPLV